MRRVNSPHSSLTNEWDTLVREFLRLACKRDATEKVSFETLLKEFSEAEKQAIDSRLAEVKQDKANFERLLEGYEEEFRLLSSPSSTSSFES
jgi:hypothetical protein